MLIFCINTRVVSTHSRPKAAGISFALGVMLPSVSTHSRPKAAGQTWDKADKSLSVSTHSRPKAAGLRQSVQAVTK